MPPARHIKNEKESDIHTFCLKFEVQETGKRRLFSVFCETNYFAGGKRYSDHVESDRPIAGMSFVERHWALPCITQNNAL